MSIYDKYKSQILAKQKAYRKFAKPYKDALEAHAIDIKAGKVTDIGSFYGVEASDIVNVFSAGADITAAGISLDNFIGDATLTPITESKRVGTGIKQRPIFQDVPTGKYNLTLNPTLVNLYDHTDVYNREDTAFKEFKNTDPLSEALGLESFDSRIASADYTIDKIAEYQSIGVIEMSSYAGRGVTHRREKSLYLPVMSQDYLSMSNKDFITEVFPTIELDFTMKPQKRKGLFAKAFGSNFITDFLDDALEAVGDLMENDIIKAIVIVFTAGQAYQAFVAYQAATATLTTAEAALASATAATSSATVASATTAAQAMATLPQVIASATAAQSAALLSLATSTISLAGQSYSFVTSVTAPDVGNVDTSTNMPTVDTRIAMNPFVNGVYTTPYDYSATYDYSNMYDYNSWYNYG